MALPEITPFLPSRTALPAPNEEVSDTFDPRGDWSTSRYGVSRAVPGMEEPPVEGGSKGKKKKKKPKTAGGTQDLTEEGEEPGDEALAQPAVPAEVEQQDQSGSASAGNKLGTPEEVSKRIKAVNKKLTQARDLAQAAREGSRELNVDQKLKIESIPTMEEELSHLNGLLASMAV